MRCAVDDRDEVEVCRGHGGDPQGDEAWSLQYNQGEAHLLQNLNELNLHQVEDVSEPLAESMEKVAEGVLLFCQV